MQEQTGLIIIFIFVLLATIHYLKKIYTTQLYSF